MCNIGRLGVYCATITTLRQCISNFQITQTENSDYVFVSKQIYVFNDTLCCIAVCSTIELYLVIGQHRLLSINDIRALCVS